MRYGYGVRFLIIIVLFLFYKSYKYEPFTTAIQQNSRERSVILLGDSTFKNNNYVKQINSIEQVLRRDGSANIYCLAKDGATIADVYKQIVEVPTTLNNKQNVIFLSVGGNDILKNKNMNKNMNMNMNMNILFEEYERLLVDLTAKFDKCKIVLFNLYTPPNINKIRKDNTLTDKIKQWNNSLDAYLYKNNNTELINVNALLYEPTDFVSGYEPSELGGHKIVTAIVNKL